MSGDFTVQSGGLSLKEDAGRSLKLQSVLAYLIYIRNVLYRKPNLSSCFGLMMTVSTRRRAENYLLSYPCHAAVAAQL